MFVRCTGVINVGHVRAGDHETSDLNTEKTLNAKRKNSASSKGCARRSMEDITTKQEGLNDTRKSKRMDSLRLVAQAAFLRLVYRILWNLIRTSFCRFLKRKKKVSSRF